MAITKLKALGVTDGTLTNTQINASAAIAKTKLASLDIVNADINANAGIVTSKLGGAGTTLQTLWHKDPGGSSNITLSAGADTYRNAMSITKKATNSEFLIMVRWTVSRASNSNAFTCGYRIWTSGSTRDFYFVQDDPNFNSVTAWFNTGDGGATQANTAAGTTHQMQYYLYDASSNTHCRWGRMILHEYLV